MTVAICIVIRYGDVTLGGKNRGIRPIGSSERSEEFLKWWMRFRLNSPFPTFPRISEDNWLQIYKYLTNTQLRTLQADLLGRYNCLYEDQENTTIERK